MRTIRVVEGLDIPIGGAPEQTISDGPAVSSVALLGEDYIGLSPRLRVQAGDRVKLGEALFTDRRHPEVKFVSPGSGIVSAVNRGARRALLSVAVRLDGDEAESFPYWSSAELSVMGSGQVQELLLASGLWAAFRTRPYSKLPVPGTTPRSIFVTAVDTNPLAPRPEVVIAEQAVAFADGMTVVSRLTDGPIYLCKAPFVELPQGRSGKVQVAEFSGPHPSGLAGTHIHFLDPVGAGGTVWHLGYQDVIAIGKLFTSGQLWTERIVALAGPPMKRPRLVRTRLGADTSALTQGELADGPTRIISGSVLSGSLAARPRNFLGRYDNQVSALAEAGQGVADDAFSIYGAAAARKGHARWHRFTSALHGRRTAMVPLGGFERVMPMDVLPTQLLRALLAADLETAQALGCLEMDAEDLALCSYVCPSKQDYGPALRNALAQIEMGA